MSYMRIAILVCDCNHVRLCILFPLCRKKWLASRWLNTARHSSRWRKQNAELIRQLMLFITNLRPLFLQLVGATFLYGDAPIQLPERPAATAQVVRFTENQVRICIDCSVVFLFPNYTLNERMLQAKCVLSMGQHPPWHTETVRFPARKLFSRHNHSPHLLKFSVAHLRYISSLL